MTTVVRYQSAVIACDKYAVLLNTSIGKVLICKTQEPKVGIQETVQIH